MCYTFAINNALGESGQLVKELSRYLLDIVQQLANGLRVLVEIPFCGQHYTTLIDIQSNNNNIGNNGSWLLLRAQDTGEQRYNC